MVSDGLRNITSQFPNHRFVAGRVARRYIEAISDITQEILEWIREHTDGEADLKTLRDRGRFSENRLKHATEEIRNLDHAEVIRPRFGPTVIRLTGV